MAGFREGQSRAGNSGDAWALCAVFRGARGSLQSGAFPPGALSGLLCLERRAES